MSGIDGRLYRTSRWAKCRTLQLGKEPMCQSCETEPAEHVDHIVNVKAGGSFWSSDNWQSLCAACHSQKTVAEMAGKTWTPVKWRGCYEDGSPRDPRHPWHRDSGKGQTLVSESPCDRGGRSIAESDTLRTASIPQKRIS